MCVEFNGAPARRFEFHLQFLTNAADYVLLGLMWPELEQAVGSRFIALLCGAVQRHLKIKKNVRAMGRRLARLFSLSSPFLVSSFFSLCSLFVLLTC